MPTIIEFNGHALDPVGLHLLLIRRFFKGSVERVSDEALAYFIDSEHTEEDIHASMRTMAAKPTDYTIRTTSDPEYWLLIP